MARVRSRWVVLLALVAGTAGIASAQQTQPSPREKALRWVQLERSLLQAFKDARYAEAEGILRQMLKLQPNDAGTQYNLACAHARMGKPDQALADLTRAVELGWDDADHTRQDEDLAPPPELVSEEAASV